jgi:hypothetical protein
MTMNRATWMALALCGLAAVGVATSGLSQTSDKKPAEPEFGPKALMIYCKDANQNTVLMDVKVRRLGEKSFLVGKIPPWQEDKSAWNKATQWVAVDEIISMFEFSSVEEAKKATAESEEQAAQEEKKKFVPQLRD